MNRDGPTGPDRFADAMHAAVLLDVGRAGVGGLTVRGGTAEIRDLLLARVKAELPEGSPSRRLPPSADPARLDGDLDVAATLAAGAAVTTPGLLAAAAGGLLVVPMAELLAPAAAARIGRALDDGTGPAVVAFDESDAGERGTAAALSDRLALRIDLDGLSVRDVVADDLAPAEDAARRAGDVTVGADDLEAVATAAEAFGVPGLRPLIQAARAARAAAALAGRRSVADEDLLLAVKLVLAPRATRLPIADEAATERPPEPPEPSETVDQDGQPGDAPLAERMVDAVRSALPADLLARLDGAVRRPPRGEQGRRGPQAAGSGAGRPAASRPGRPAGASRLDILETLRAAVPFQRLRARPPAGCLLALRPADLRIRRRRRPMRSTAIFVVDASGSSAVRRLAEAKGAVESVLADAYVRRDRVAMIAFRGTGAEVLLPPTGSLTLARRRLLDLPAGGGTPIAAGLAAAAEMAARVKAAGQRPLVILLTDGEANVALDGRGGRAKAEADAIAAAGLLRAGRTAALLIDISDRPSARAGRIAEALGGTWQPLPYADASRMAAAVREAARGP